MGVPNDNPIGNAEPETDTTYVCIGTGKSVYIDATEMFNVSSGWVHLQGYWLGKNATLTVGQGTALFNNDPVSPSVIEEGAALNVTAAYLGGQGTLRVKAGGTVSIAGAAQPVGASSLSSGHPHQVTLASEGRVVVESGGQLRLPALGVNLSRGYDIDVEGRMAMTASGFLAPSYDSVVTVESTGTYEFGGFGGFYESPRPSGVDSIPSLVNHGTLLKSGPATAVIAPNIYGYVEDADPVNHIDVTGGTAAFAGGTAYTADVHGGQQLSTAKCAVRDPSQPCQEEKGRSANSVSFTVPGPASVESVVNVFETAPLDFTAHIAALPPGAGPATITFRLGSDVVGTIQPADVQIRHDNDIGYIPSCVSSRVARRSHELRGPRGEHATTRPTAVCSWSCAPSRPAAMSATRTTSPPRPSPSALRRSGRVSKRPFKSSRERTSPAGSR